MKDINTLDMAGLEKLLSETYAKLFNLNVRQSDENFKPHEYKLFRKTIARVLTRKKILKETGGSNESN